MRSLAQIARRLGMRLILARFQMRGVRLRVGCTWLVFPQHRGRDACGHILVFVFGIAGGLSGLIFHLF